MSPKSIHGFAMKNIDGKKIELSDFDGDVLLVVNTASKCGYTPQYADLEAVYEKYREKGFKVLAFPANEFGAQEPGTNDEIKAFCTTNYDVKFPLFSKIVVKGEGIHPLYQYLTDEEAHPKTGGEIKWNFTKFLVGKDGKVLARFEPKVKPTDEEVTKALEDALAVKYEKKAKATATP
ncbi:glutathione peroxidase [Candidatus Poribacteria bacterium]|nr:glutathione peroxidase [Candidatus Poribacteria bacterium]